MRGIWKNILMMVASTLLLGAAKAQTGTIGGKVMDAATNDPLIGATVAIENSSLGAVTDLDGSFILANIPVGIITLKISYVGYESKQLSGVTVIANVTSSLTITLNTAESNTLDEVIVQTDVRKETIGALLVARKNSAVVSDAIGADMIRKSPDKNTSEVLKRVSGVTVQDNKFVLVRGMNDRYNDAMLNGSVLPSSEPDRKTFAFDIFPAAVIDNITVVKSATPDLPGDFSGGLVQVNTKEIPDENFLTLKAGESFNSTSTFNPYTTYPGGKNDWLGIDDGTRGLPGGFPDKETYFTMSGTNKILAAQTLENNWGYHSESSSPLNPSIQVAGGFNLHHHSNPSFGGIFGVTYNDSRKFYAVDRYDFYGHSEAGDDTVYKYRDSSYQRNVLTSALADLSFKLNANNKFYFNNIYSINSNDNTILRNGYSFSEGLYAKSNSFYFASNRIYSSQFSGEHYVTKLKLKIKWDGFYTNLKRDEPDYRINRYLSDVVGGPYYGQFSSSPGTNIFAGSHYYGVIDDQSGGGNLDLSIPFKLFSKTQTLKAGGAIFHDERNRDVRNFSAYISDPSGFNFNYYFASQDTVYAPEHFDLNKGFALFEDHSPTNHYDGTIDNTAAYLMLDNRFSEKFRLVWGVRAENYHYTLNTFDQNLNPLLLDTTYLDFLPSANLIVSVLKDANLRLSFSQTVARPSYRELANAPFYDFLQNVTYYGNPELVETHISNYEVRWEHYFEDAQYYSLSTFYKEFKDPIEAQDWFPGSDSRSLKYGNAPKATNIGVELEARKHFGFLGKGWENLFAYANFAYIKSKVSTSVIQAPDSSVTRPLQGQSPLVFNAMLQYTEPKTNLGISMLFNYIGDRLLQVGNITDEPVWQRTHPILDLKVSKTFLKNGLVEVAWSDILHGHDILFYDLDRDETLSKTASDYSNSDRIVVKQSFGYNLSLAVSYKF